MKRYKVTISNRGHIPGMGNGPFMRPLAISETQYKSLVKLGYKVKIVEDLLAKAKVITSSQSIKIEKPIIKEEKLPETKKEEIVKKEEIIKKEKTSKKESKPKEDELAVEEVIEEKVDDVQEDEDVVLIDDPDLSAEAYYNREFLTSKNICKKILNARMVQYETSASITMLRKLVLDSNPSIDDSIEE